jgi:hypothetical protein
MTVAELIAILQTFDPATEVVISTYDDRSDDHNVLELRRNDSMIVALRTTTPMHSWFDYPKAQLSEVEDGGPVAGVNIG